MHDFGTYFASGRLKIFVTVSFIIEKILILDSVKVFTVQNRIQIFLSEYCFKNFAAPVTARFGHQTKKSQVIHTDLWF